MRPLLLLSSFTVGLVLSAQPGDPSLFIPMQRPEPTIELRLEPSIQHEPRRNGLSSPVVYGLTDTIVVSITGHVKLDGGCGGGKSLYGFQRKDGDTWTEYIQPGTIQMCCGMPTAFWREHLIALVPSHVARPAYGKPWMPGEYRVVMALVGEQFLVGPAFVVVDE